MVTLLVLAAGVWGLTLWVQLFGVDLIVEGSLVDLSDSGAVITVALLAVTGILGLLLWALTNYFAACCWHRDRDPAAREQLAATPLTAKQLIGGKTLIWLLPGVLVVGLNLITWLPIALLGLILPRLSRLVWETQAGSEIIASNGSVETLIGLAAVVIHGIRALLTNLVSLGVITRLSVAGVRPALSVVLLAAVMCAVLFAAILPIMGMGAFVGLLGVEEDSVIPTVAGLAISPVILGLVCFLVWKGLPAAVDRLFRPGD
jgi:hypothetical protein